MRQQLVNLNQSWQTHLPRDMAFDGEYAGGVVQLLANVLTDALEGAAAWVVSVVRFVMGQCARKLSR